MYVCVFVTHPSVVEQPPAPRRGGAPGGSRPRGGRGGSPWERVEKGRGGGRGNGLGGPKAPCLSGLAWAAPSPGRASQRAPVGTVLAQPLRGIPLRAVPGAPPGSLAQAGPGYSSQRTAQGGGLGRQVLGTRGRVLSAWFASSARRPGRSKTRSRQSPLSGPSPWTVLPPGGWQEPFRVRSRLPPVVPAWRVKWVASG